MKAQTNVQSLKQPVIVGLDIGNGHVKLVSNITSAPIVFQSLAAPVEHTASGLTGEPIGDHVMIEGQAWKTAFPAHQSTYSHATHKGAALSNAHYALFLEALSRFNSDIDIAAVGLTSDQIGDKQTRIALRERFSGLHVVRGREIFVDKVGVFEQPIGTARQYIHENRHAIGNQTFLIVDIGYGTTDINRVRVSIDEDGVPVASTDFSMSEWLAVSQACEQAAHSLNETVTPTMISLALRQDGKVKKGQCAIEVRSHVEEATKLIGERLAASIKAKLRKMDDIDLVILTGGGASLFLNSLDLARPTEVMPNSSLANAHGYVLLAKDHA